LIDSKIKKMYSPLAQFDIICVFPIFLESIGLDFSINNLVLSLFLGIILGIIFLNGFVVTYLIPYN